ncbi:Hydroxyacylglutathione hydrolase, mitochondrial [Galdieria sulphuraria]|uniref:hydroxyacylglutathione hydrolase n=1 Tax=Galdieria sulphuraria TaxID=130081 RepID=M2WRV7_GALSU|nr:hydroxyacylglutathione hydrolase [Galdieria sulphuraria]EME26560.1 hydroxyacylglutathione hydrolase [Galdieria sulphuraria]GJD07364.1 Hydroxyacylglutathione hydrolase, mitochondrial [Galdieria sulphuraria]|eukprot:XP_005703080.1 hydroxyacylglutathione hydrolase [Galdieria sulphuraria]
MLLGGKSAFQGVVVWAGKRYFTTNRSTCKTVFSPCKHFSYSVVFRANRLRELDNRELSVSRSLHRCSFSSTCSISENLQVRTIPVLRDNYAYLLIDKRHKVAAAVDPVEPTKVTRAAEEEGVSLVAVLTTHKHWDHSGGNEELLEKYSSLKIFGSKYEIVPGTTHRVGQGDIFQFYSPSCLEVYVYCTPCHTRGHLLYFVKERDAIGSSAVLFSGDTLFIGGCGRFFEGDSNDMLQNIEQVIHRFPRNTFMFCGHEYTLKNLEFALQMEPHNQILKEKYDWAKKQLELGKCTVPSTLEEEFLYNPFLRYGEASIQQAVQQSEPAKVLAELRKRKDVF